MDARDKTIAVYNTDGTEVGTVTLDPVVFDGTINIPAMHQAVNAYRCNQRMGLAATKTRGEVSGGGKKPWRQKGTGRARVGSTRSPLWRHGGVVFGPHPRDFSISISSTIKNLALKSSLNAKIRENNIVVLDSLSPTVQKTKEAAAIFKNLKIKAPKSGAVLLLWEKKDAILHRALRNIGFLDVNAARDTNVYEVLTHHKIVITRIGLEQLTKRLKP